MTTAADAARRSRRLLAGTLVALSGVALLASACTGSSAPAASSAAPTTATPTPTPTPTTTTPAPTPKPKPKPKPTNPLTGLGPAPRYPVVAVKMDDTPPGRPQVGIDKADVVYIEAVEGGLTRLAAIFAGRHPAKVGYVRSTRPSDPDLLLQYGKITEAYSGGAHDSLPRVYRSGITSWSNDAGAPFYFRSPHSGDHGYINLALDVAKVAGRVHTPRARSIGWTFNASLKGIATVLGTDMRTHVSGSYPYSAGTPVEFRWAPRLHKYVRYIDGVMQVAADGRPIAATNVVVQLCRVVSHPSDTDVVGNPSQFTYTVGGGAVYVFRQGRMIKGHWSRRSVHEGTSLLLPNNRPLPLAPGNTWVVLPRHGQPVYRR